MEFLKKHWSELGVFVVIFGVGLIALVWVAGLKSQYSYAAQQCYQTKVQTAPIPDICSVKGPYEFDAGAATKTRVYAYVKTCTGSGGTFSQDYAYTACARYWPFEDQVPDPNKGKWPIRCQTTGWVKVK